MLLNEARWIGEQLESFSAIELSPMLNVGSATAEFRERTQPWIDQMIFLPLRQRGTEVQYTDLHDGPGVDVCGDLSDDSLIDALMTRRYRSILCCNLLEHVRDPRAICAKLQRLLPQNGYIVVTVPRCFPYHPDPIDTMFRPTPEEIGQMFPYCRMLERDIVDCGTGWDYVGRDVRVLIDRVKRRVAGCGQHGGLKGSTSFAPWLFRRFRQSCVVLQKHCE